MKTYHRTVKIPVHIEEDGIVFDLPAGKEILTSEIREENGQPVVTVLSNYWVTLPFAHFEGGRPAYGHTPLKLA